MGSNRPTSAHPSQRRPTQMMTKLFCVKRKWMKNNEWSLERKSRLRANTARLYHVTSEENGKKILKSGRMYRGIQGWAGGGIYFATTPAAARSKARNSGVMLSATVLLGIVKHVTGFEGNIKKIHFRSLIREKCDSVSIDLAQTGQEYVVYNYDQVMNIRR